MVIHGEVTWCPCGRVRPARSDTGLCEACTASERYKAEREAERANSRSSDRIS